MADPKMNINHRTLVIKAGMTPQDVMKSDKATAEQKKMAFVFDSDGIAGYSQREADVFNATLIADHGKQGISLWTRYQDDSKKETKFVGDVASFKYAPKGDVKPYVVKKGFQTKNSQSTHVTSNAQTKLKEMPLPPLTTVESLDTLTFYSKKDSMEYMKKSPYFGLDYRTNVRNEELEKRTQIRNEELEKRTQIRDEESKYRTNVRSTNKDDSKIRESYAREDNKTKESYTRERLAVNKSYEKESLLINKAYLQEKEARNEHCSQVREFGHK